MSKSTIFPVALPLLCCILWVESYSGTSTCRCPQTSESWMLYDDSNPVPDFFERENLEVMEILVCDHGIHFYFVARQQGQEYYTSLVIVKPTAELYRERKPARRRDELCLSLEERVEKALCVYERSKGELRRVLGDLFVEYVPMRFDLGTSPPRIHPKEDLKLKWRDTEMKIRGYLDVYLSVFV